MGTRNNVKGSLCTDAPFVCCFGFNKSLMRAFKPQDDRYARRAVL